jgi:hypothetical protein
VVAARSLSIFYLSIRFPAPMLNMHSFSPATPANQLATDAVARLSHRLSILVGLVSSIPLGLRDSPC